MIDPNVFGPGPLVREEIRHLAELIRHATRPVNAAPPLVWESDGTAQRLWLEESVLRQVVGGALLVKVTGNALVSSVVRHSWTEQEVIEPTQATAVQDKVGGQNGSTGSAYLVFLTDNGAPFGAAVPDDTVTLAWKSTVGNWFYSFTSLLDLIVREADGSPSDSPVLTLEFDGATVANQSPGVTRVSVTGGSAPAFHGARGGMQKTSVADSTSVKLEFSGGNDGEYDTDFYVDSTNDRFVVGSEFPGYYLIGGEVDWGVGNPGITEIALWILKNGSQVIGQNVLQQPGTQFFLPRHQVHALFHLAEDDYVELWAYQVSGNSQSILTGGGVPTSGGSHFWLTYLGGG